MLICQEKKCTNDPYIIVQSLCTEPGGEVRGGTWKVVALYTDPEQQQGRGIYKEGGQAVTGIQIMALFRPMLFRSHFSHGCRNLLIVLFVYCTKTFVYSSMPNLIANPRSSLLFITCLIYFERVSFG